MDGEPEPIARVLRRDLRDLDALDLPTCGAELVGYEPMGAAEVEEPTRRRLAHPGEARELATRVDAVKLVVGCVVDVLADAATGEVRLAVQRRRLLRRRHGVEMDEPTVGAG